MDLQSENGGLSSYSEELNGDSEQTGLVAWLNSLLPDLNMPTEASETDIRACLLDGTVLCCILNRLSPGSVEMGDESEPHPAKIMRFLSVLERKGLPKFEVSDLEQGSLLQVFRCLQRLRADLQINNADGEPTYCHVRKRWSLPEEESLCVVDHSRGDDQQSANLGSEKCRNSRDSKYRTILSSADFNEASALSEPRSKYREVCHTKKGLHYDLQNLKISDLIKWNSLDKAPTQLLFSMVDKVLDESFERKNGDVPHRVACLLRKLIREIERRISSQADKTKNQNKLAKSREGKYQSKVRALGTLATGAAEESQVVMKQLRQMKTEKMKLKDKKKCDERDVVKLLKEIDQRDAEIVSLKQASEEAKTSYGNHCLELEIRMKETHVDFEKKVQDLNCLLEDSKSKVKELEEFSEIQMQRWKKKELRYQNFIDSQHILLQGLREDLNNVRREVLTKKKLYPVEFQNLGLGLKELVDAAENYHMVLSENRRLYNEVQDLKGNIRVHCRIRPFLPGQSEKQTTIDYIGENGELVVTNPMKQGKETRRLFKFNKVFAQTASQEEVFKDTQPLVRSVLDGYNVCIFAYGQTGSGKTYTMSGPDISSQKDWGVNYRALHDLFQISQNRRRSILYEVSVQMVEIYNEQVRDLLASDGPQKRLGIWSSSQPNGLAVPEASMHPVKTTGDVLELMNIGLMNRAVGATALNERSSRSHSILSVHVRGTELKDNSVLRGCLHLVDLAGSERVDRTGATGDRLKEAQHINKSLSALGDVIFSLAQKNAHVPYRNSKLTQILQSSLGGQAKTLMFVQLNPDPESHSETISTLKFAERVSGVELGAARSNKEGRDVRELMEQVSSLKEAILRKDEEIEHLRLMKVNASVQKRGMSTIRGSTSSPSSFPRRHSLGPTRKSRTSSSLKTSGNFKRINSYQDKYSEQSEKQSEASSSQHSMDENRIQKESFRQTELVAPDLAPSNNDDIDLLGFGDGDSEERLSDISDSGLSMGTETDGSIGSVVEYTLFPEVAKPAEITEKPSIPSKLPKPPVKPEPAISSHSAPPKASMKVVPVSGFREAPIANGLPTRPKLKPVRRWQ